MAVHQAGKLLASYELLAEKSHSGLLTTLITEAVRHTGFILSDLDAIAVAKGPGSYTGLRIGTSTAKGLCYTLEKPLLAVNTLEAMAYQLKDFFDETHLLCPMIDARRMEVYCGIYQKQKLLLDQTTEASFLKEIQATEAKIIDSSAFETLLSQHKTVFFGDGAAKCKDQLGQQPNAIFLETEIYPSAKTIGFLATQRFINHQIEDLVSFEPFYLKDFFMPVKKASK